MTDQDDLKLTASQLFAEIRNDLPTSVEAPLGSMLDQLQRQIHELEDLRTLVDPTGSFSEPQVIEEASSLWDRVRVLEQKIGLELDPKLHPPERARRLDLFSERQDKLENQVADLVAWRAIVVEKDLTRLRGIVTKLAERIEELWKWYDRSLHRVAETELDNQRHRKDGVLSDLNRCLQEIRTTYDTARSPKLARWANTLEATVSRLGDML